MANTKVLIFGQTFNNRHGGGITLTNLFRGWPKDKIAVTETGHMMHDITTDICDNYYQLGSDEFKWRFPFNLLQKKYSSGVKSFTGSYKDDHQPDPSKSGIRSSVVNRLFYPFLQWLGLFYCSSRIEISTRFREWLSGFSPDLLYAQVSTRESVLFIAELIDYLGVPSVIHFMDDWPSTIGRKGLFGDFWNRKIDRELRVLLDKVDLHLSISDAMSLEYRKRYEKEFIAFHNPIDTEFWLSSAKVDFTIREDNVKILCSGRIGHNGISESLIEVASAIDKMNKDTDRIKFHIQTASRDKVIIERLSKFRCVVFNPFAKYDQLPGIFSGADILLLANDFNRESINYLRYSMPTKASEYLISGTPVLVYTSDQAAVSAFFRENKCGYCVSTQSEEEIIKAISFLLDNEECRREISRNAIKIARERFDASIVRNQFQSLLINLKKQKNNVY